MLETFYNATAQLSFALLGFWWVAFSLNYERWMKNRIYRRLAYHISLSFLLPGVVSLSSLLATRVESVWRFGFGAGGALGVLATINVVRNTRRRTSPVGRTTWLFSGLIYALFITVAAVPDLSEGGRVDLTGLEIEGILLTVQLLTTAYAAWRLFARPEAEEEGTATPEAKVEEKEEEEEAATTENEVEQEQQTGEAEPKPKKKPKKKVSRASGRQRRESQTSQADAPGSAAKS